MNLTRRHFNLLAPVTAISSMIVPVAVAAQAAGTVIEYANEPAVLPQIDRNGPALIRAKFLHGLIDHDADLNPIPGVALSWEQSGNALGILQTRAVPLWRAWGGCADLPAPSV